MTLKKVKTIGTDWFKKRVQLYSLYDQKNKLSLNILSRGAMMVQHYQSGRLLILGVLDKTTNLTYICNLPIKKTIIMNHPSLTSNQVAHQKLPKWLIHNAKCITEKSYLMNHLLLISNQVAHQNTSKMADPQWQMYKRKRIYLDLYHPQFNLQEEQI